MDSAAYLTLAFQFWLQEFRVLFCAVNF